MADRLRFVQVSHPQGEARPHPGRRQELGWNSLGEEHKRKFLQFPGEWIEQDGSACAGSLRAWGEWEPESTLVCEFKKQAGDTDHPRYLWNPHCRARKSYRSLHNTDPFIFGDRFLYSNCGQVGKGREGLRQLAQGSVIVFGSRKKLNGESKWMLDTVLVVKDSLSYDGAKACEDLQGCVPPEFLVATAGPMARNPKTNKTRLRLYRGATPRDRSFGMFSFFPALPTDRDDGFGFPRPFVCLPREFLSPASRFPKGYGLDCAVEPPQLAGLWGSLVRQVRAAGLVLGTQAGLPRLES